jgi:hypothetical protein
LNEGETVGSVTTVPLEEKDTAFMKKFCGKPKEVGPAVYLSFMSRSTVVNHISP